MQAELMERNDRPSYVRFVREPVEDKAESLKQGRYVAKDVDYALVTPPYSKDINKLKVSSFFAELEYNLQNDRIPRSWVEQHKEAYRLWQNGQEAPVNGSPIRGWGVISPAQQETLLRLNILTVEDLAGCNDEGLRRIGMGALELKNKAKAWLAQLNDKGPMTQKIAALERENEVLRGSLETLEAQIRELQSKTVVAPVDSSADEFIGPPEPVKRKRA